MSSSDVTERACIGLANQLILEFQLPIPRIQHMSEIASTTFVYLFQALCGYVPNGVLEYPQTREDEVRNVQIIIDTLAITFLHLPLTHIKGRSVIEMEAVSVYNLLEIFQAYAKHASMPQQSETSSSPTTTSPATADENFQHSQVGTGSSTNPPSWSSSLSEDTASRCSATSKGLPQETIINKSSFSDKRIRSPCYIDLSHVAAASENREPLRNCTQTTWANELRKKCCSSVEDNTSINHRCDCGQSSCEVSASSSYNDALCERCKQSLRKLRHGVKSPFKKMRMSPRQEEIWRKHYCSNCIDLDGKINFSGQKADDYIHTKLIRVNNVRKSPSHQTLGNLICVNCKAHAKENYGHHKFPDVTAPALPVQSCPVSSYLHDSSLCANCKLSLSKQGKSKYQHSGVSPTTPQRGSLCLNAERVENAGNYSILHQCPKAEHLRAVKTCPHDSTRICRRKCVEVSGNRLFSIISPSQESVDNKWSSHKIKKNWSYPVARTAKGCSPTDNSFSSSSPDLLIGRNHNSGQRQHSVVHNSTIRSPDLGSGQETDEGPIKLRFHGSSKQVRFGDPHGHLETSKKSYCSVKIPSCDASPRVSYVSKFQNNSRELNISSKQKFLSNIKQPAKRIASSTARKSRKPPRGRRHLSKSPSPRETLIMHHSRNHLIPCRSRTENNGQKLSDVGDHDSEISFPFMRASIRERAGSGLPLAWQDGVVKCAATYGFRVPDSASTSIENELLKRTEIDEENRNQRVLLKRNQQDLLQLLQQEFPYFAVPKSSIENLRNRYLQDMKRMTNLYLTGYAGKVASLESYNLLKRQLELQNMMSRDLEAVQRKSDLQVHQYQWRKMQGMGRDQRIQSVHIKRYSEDHQIAERSKMLRKRTNEEMLFKQLYEEGMESLQDKLRDMKRHVKDDLLQFRNEHRGILEIIHNHYKNELEVLAQTVASQKHHLEDQEMTLKRTQREFRQKLQESLMAAQEEVLRRDEEDFHFREQDKDHVKEFFKKS